MSLLIAENIYKTYGEKTLFDHISFTIEEKERIGLIGVNGTGKSSLLKIIADLDRPEEGRLLHAKHFHIEYLSQSPRFEEDLTVLEQIYYGESELMRLLKRYEEILVALEEHPDNQGLQDKFFNIQQEMDAKNAWEASTLAKTILTRLGIRDYHQQVQQLSGGQRKRVAIAKALIQPADLLILDEPTNHLDNDTIEWLEVYLSQYPGALLLVTHDRYFLNRVVNKIYELDKGQLYEYEGNYEIFLEKKAEREELEVQDERKRQNHLRRELSWIRRGAKARSTKQKARIDRFNDLKNQKKDLSKGQIDIQTGAARLGDQVLELTNVSKAFAGRPLIKAFDYLVVPGERLGIVGPNGSGKSTLLNMMAGRITPDSGRIDVGQTVQIGYYKQSDVDIDGDLRVLDYIKERAEGIQTEEGQWVTAEQMLERFLFPRSMQRTYVRRLSGGEQRRLYLLKVLMAEPNVILLDEPTNDLDTATLAILEDYLDHFPGVVITVSHDRYFLDRVVDRLLVFAGDGKISRYEGNYSEYIEQVKQQSQKSEAAVGKVKAEEQKAQRQERAPRLKLSFKEQKEWDEIEDKIAQLEEKQTHLAAEIASAGSDIGRVQDLYKEQEQVDKALEDAMERWTELSIKIEAIEEQKKSKA
ncbi:ATP-binding cassette subfamily F protein uup [Pullulanibacillus pueri]|uniref:Putative ABC transporter ATP-binding protein YfmR n=1 Tax=Pullulanibacillus pueri TaxID=1437324 RepID=A0A8J2ZZY7_9BACL|nr:ABC-F family ATP-binding cassette domain-containing protein [Pullulanibacillus pueri]MBM7684030.1 ATP-binding cassette subfamily F protein uup [Pullulanibacillus pueri]GGH88515.1 putative ABC transporter ATP-binding protein YfmR [Pullulanibacillus pueri]